MELRVLRTVVSRLKRVQLLCLFFCLAFHNGLLLLFPLLHFQSPQSIRRQKHHDRRFPIVKRSTTWTVTARSDISSFQTETENALVWTWLLLKPWRIVTFVFHALYKYSIYRVAQLK